MPKNPEKNPTGDFGAPVVSEEHSLTVGPDGPIVLHDVHLVESLAHFNRENVPERRPHAKGSGAFGVFEVTEDISKYTHADFLQKGKKTPMLARFSTVAGEMGSPDTWRDVRGFSLKFYTQEGNFDMVGNNTPTFFMRDPLKFPHFIRSQKRLPDRGLRDNNMQCDFWSLSPESAHQVSYLMGPRGIPKSYRHMNGYSSHTYSLINSEGELFWVRWHFHTEQGVQNLTNDEAEKLAGSDPDFHRQDLFEAIDRGEYPSWRVDFQIMPYEEAKTYRFNPFDLTKTISKKDYPLIPVGKFTLNQNPTNFFTQIEQAAFAPSNIVPGTGLSPDKMLLGRAFAYADAQRNRIGTNYAQLPVNRPVVDTNAYTFDGQMAFEDSGDAPVYAPNSYGRDWGQAGGVDEASWQSDGELVRSAATLHSEDDDFSQAHDLVRNIYTDQERADLVDTVVGMLNEGQGKEPVLTNVIKYWKNIDQEVGAAIEKGLRA